MVGESGLVGGAVGVGSSEFGGVQWTAMRNKRDPFIGPLLTPNSKLQTQISIAITRSFTLVPESPVRTSAPTASSAG